MFYFAHMHLGTLGAIQVLRNAIVSGGGGGLRISKRYKGMGEWV